MERHLHLGNYENPRHMELGLLTHRDCNGRVTEIQTKPYSPGIHTQLPKEQKFSHGPVLPLLLGDISSKLVLVSLTGKYDSFDKSFQSF